MDCLKLRHLMLVCAICLFAIACGGDEGTTPVSTPADVAADVSDPVDAAAVDSGSTSEDTSSTAADTATTPEDSGSSTEDTASGEEDSAVIEPDTAVIEPDTAAPPECQTDNDCVDIISGLDQCQEPLCDSGICIAKSKDDGAKCDDGNACTKEDSCTSGVCTSAKPVQCDDSNPCTKDACDASTGSCTNEKLSTGTPCGASKVCKAGGCLAPDACSSGVCCDDSTKSIKAKGSKCSMKPVKEEFECDNNVLRKRSVFKGCTGNQAETCSDYPANYAFGDWQTVKACSKTEACNVKTKTCDSKAACQDDKNCPDAQICKDGACVKDTSVQCTTGKCCDWAQGTFKKAGVQCGTVSKSTEWRCTGMKLEKRLGYKGCNGKSSACANNTADYVFSAWKVDKTCGKSQVCQQEPPGCVAPPPKCEVGLCCDPATGYKAKGTKCGATVVKTEAKCFGNDSKQRSTYQGCSGTSSTCSASKNDYYVSDWGTGLSCQYGCDAKTGACKPKTGCTQGLCCNKMSKTFYPMSFKCGTSKKKTEYKCEAGSQFSRVAYDGCNGIGAKCSSAIKNYHWTAWNLNEKCLAGCDKSTGKCIQNQCTKGQCCVPVVNLLSPKNAECVGAATKKRVRCVDASSGSTLITEKGTYLCDGGKSACPKSDELIKWEQSAIPVPCQFGCDKTKTKCKVPECPPGGENVCCEANGSYSKVGTKCPTSLLPVGVEHQCVTKGSKKYSKSRSLYFGCSGSSKTCSANSKNFVKGNWGPDKQCSFGCASDGSCKDKQCSSGECCITISGTFSPKKAKCGKDVKDTYYVCKPIAGIQWSQEYKKYEGCSGTSDKCTSSTTNYAHVTGTLVPCSVGCDSKTGKCKPKECTSGSCCTSAGKYFDKKAKCGGGDGLAPVTTETKCSLNLLTKKSVQESRYAYKGCSGSSGTCSTSKDNYYWTSWGSSKVCSYGCDGTKCAAQQCISGTCCNLLYGKYLPTGTKCSSVVKDSKYQCSCSPIGCWSSKQVRFEACSGTKNTCGGGVTTWLSSDAEPAKYCLGGCTADGKCK